METSKMTPLSASKSKKPFHSAAPSDQKVRTVSDPDPNPLSVNTPAKPVDPPRQLRRRTTVMSINDIRQAAMKLRERKSDPVAQPEPSNGSGKEAISASKKKSVDVKLPEKYELLEEFFNSMESSIRLLQLKGYPATFTSISLQVDCLTERRFTHSHLAQLKFIMPEAIVVEKILQLDERTSCMKPDLLVSLNFEACERERKFKSHGKNLQLRKIFHGRLLDFFKSHPEGDEVPEESLPEPFGRSKVDTSTKSCRDSATCLMNETSNVVPLDRQVVTASHLSPSFRKSFTQKGSCNGSEKMPQEQSVISLPVSEPKFTGIPSRQENIANAIKSPTKSSLKATSGVVPVSPLLETPVKYSNSIKDKDPSFSLLRTPLETVSTPLKLMSSTPMLQPPKRRLMSSDDKSPSKLVRRPPPNRPLKFDTPVKKVKIEDNFGRSENSLTDEDIFEILPEALLNSIREKEMKAAIEQDPDISQAKRRKQMMVGLPKLFDMIFYLFQSIKRSVVTKEELIHKVIAGNLQIVDRREVEEQLRLLQELAPEWIWEKSSLTGDTLLCVNKISSPEAIRTRLNEAK